MSEASEIWNPILPPDFKWRPMQIDVERTSSADIYKALCDRAVIFSTMCTRCRGRIWYRHLSWEDLDLILKLGFRVRVFDRTAGLFEQFVSEEHEFEEEAEM